ncbi:unnamed protein product [Allacma fusca]|uniref:Peptidase M12B domain-containing protein n=1 Tax=Allacma fusca TaxID=39272 RepID=A0A8J2P196_9HEXA|nr:unnamed protein product [Allacma fusca]
MDILYKNDSNPSTETVLSASEEIVKTFMNVTISPSQWLRGSVTQILNASIKLRGKRDYGSDNNMIENYNVISTTTEKFDGDVFNALRSTGVICNLCVVADKEFMHAHGRGELPELKRQLEKLIDSVSWLWRTIDWNGDNFPDNIGFKIMRFDEWDPYPGEEFEHYQTPYPALSLLSKLGVIDFGDCCLGVGFTMRQFLQKQVGVSLVASPTMVGGVCDYRTTAPDFQSRNVVLISGRGFDGYPLLSTDLEQVLLHELGHSFGVTRHDNDWVRTGKKRARECSGHPVNNVRDSRYGTDYLLTVDPPGGRFIMWRNNEQGKRIFKWNNLQFSACSKYEVSLMLESKRGICFTEEIEPFCGNGILESFEICDCGNELNCRLMTCCGSKRSNNPCQKIESFDTTGSNKACTTKYAYPFSIAKSRMQLQQQKVMQNQIVSDEEMKSDGSRR